MTAPLTIVPTAPGRLQPSAILLRGSQSGLFGQVLGPTHPPLLGHMADTHGDTPDEQAEMQRYFTDPNTFVIENEKLNDAIVDLRRRYDARIAEIKPELEDLTRDRSNQFRVGNLSTLLPRFLIRINNNAQSFLSAGLNFLRETVDRVSNHVQAKVAHFHHAHLMIGNVMDEHLASFAARLQGLSARVKGIEHFIGITASFATAHSRELPDGELAIMQRLNALEVSTQKLKSEVLTLKLARLRTKEGAEGGRSRDVSPAGRSVGSERSLASSRPSSLHEAHLNLELASQGGPLSDRVRAAQDVAYFRCSPR